MQGASRHVLTLFNLGLSLKLFFNTSNENLRDRHLHSLTFVKNDKGVFSIFFKEGSLIYLVNSLYYFLVVLTKRKVVEFIFFATRLKELRTANGFTQESFAKKLGISKQAYRKYEQGQGFPRPEILKDICLLLNTSEDYLNNTEILPVYQKLSNARQENTIAYAKKQLEEQEKENNILPLILH